MCTIVPLIHPQAPIHPEIVRSSYWGRELTDGCGKAGGEWLQEGLAGSGCGEGWREWLRGRAGGSGCGKDWLEWLQRADRW